MNVLEALQGARELIATPDKWTQGHIARDKDGEPCDVLSEDAVCFCAIGALYKVVGIEPLYYAGADESKIGVLVGAEALMRAAINGLPADYNDRSTHDDVMTMFNSAIVRARADNL